MLLHAINASDQCRRDRISIRPGARLHAALRWALAVALVMLTTVVVAAKPPYVIENHLLERADKRAEHVSSVEAVHGEALEDLLEVRVWKVEYRQEGDDGTSLVFMAVNNGEVVRIRRFDEPAARDNLVNLLRDDFRVTSKDDAARLVSATLALHFGFPFSEPEKTVEEMHVESRDGEYFFVDGERFGEATGYHITTDGEGRVTGYEYSWELPVDLPAKG